jgi:NADPH:quinone reductase-like Zn-dependent oxidoreductase
MPKAVRFDEYGGVDVLEVRDVDMPEPKDHEVVVAVKAAGINPGEDKIRQGMMHDRFPATFPSGEGTDFAGVVHAVGLGVGKCKVGDEVAGYTHNRASHAEFVVVDEQNVTPKPATVSWEVAGSLFVAGTTAYAAVEAVNVQPDDKVIVSGAAGGVGSIAVQLARAKKADVYGIAGPHDAKWLISRGITPISYDGDVLTELQQAKADKPDAFIDTVGHGYVKMAVELGIDPSRINTITDYAAAEQYKVKAVGTAAASRIDVLAKLLEQASNNTIEVPIAKTFPLEEVREAYRFIDSQHHRGKVVLLPS